MTNQTVEFDWSDPVLAAEHLGRVHFIGIGGAGMSAVAKVMLGRKMVVTGSDAKDVPVLAELTELGATVWVGFNPDKIAEADTVVVGSAIRPDNPEVIAAQELGKHLIHRSQALQGVMAGRRSIAVAGTNGKTTTSALLSHLLVHIGAEPSYAIGGNLVSTGTNGAYGAGEVFVAEACESDRSFVVYRPSVAIVTNVQPDHLDFYGTFTEVAHAFDDFIGRLPEDGTLIACADDPGSAAAAATRQDAGLPVQTYGFADDADIRITDFKQSGGSAQFSLTVSDDEPVVINIQVPGQHNASNATAAYAAARALGMSASGCVAGLASFTGARRRFEKSGERNNVVVYDDYAHNPAKVAAAVKTGKSVAGDGRVLAIFQPHLFSRTQDFATEFGLALASADQIIVMDVYAAREDPIPGVTGQLVSDAVTGPEGRVRFIADRDRVVEFATQWATPGDVILTIGAGDITELAPQIVDALPPADGAPAGEPATL